MKRKIKVTAVEAITKTLHKESTEFILHVPSEYDYRYLGEYREDVLQLVKQVHFQITNRNLPVYGVETFTLKDYVTTKQDRKKNIFRIPDESYRTTKEDITAEAKTMQTYWKKSPICKKSKTQKYYMLVIKKLFPLNYAISYY